MIMMIVIAHGQSTATANVDRPWWTTANQVLVGETFCNAGLKLKLKYADVH